MKTLSKKNKLIAAKNFIYVLIILILFVLETTPAFLRLGGVKPKLMMAFCIIVAIFEAEFTGGLLGALAGVLYDYMSYTFVGFFSIQMLVICTATGLAFIYLIKNTKVSALAVTAGILTFFSLSEFYFFYAMWRTPGSLKLLTHSLLPQVLYTLPFAFLFYILVSKINGYFKEKLDDQY